MRSCSIPLLVKPLLYLIKVTLRFFSSYYVDTPSFKDITSIPKKGLINITPLLHFYFFLIDKIFKNKLENNHPYKVQNH